MADRSIPHTSVVCDAAIILSQPLDIRALALHYAKSFAPLLAGLLLFLTIRGHFEWLQALQVSTWPSAPPQACAGIACDQTIRLERMLRVLLFVSAALPLMNNLNYIFEVRNAARERPEETGSGRDRARTFALVVAWLVALVNIVWLFMIWREPAFVRTGLNDIFIVGIFASFLILDSLLAYSYRPTARAEDRRPSGINRADDSLQYDFFLGNACFIDLPVAVGVLCVFLMSHSLGASSAATGASTAVQAMSAGASIMHLIASQFIFCMLTVQLATRRHRLKMVLGAYVTPN